MTVSIERLREYSNKFKCGTECSTCPFLKNCKKLDEQNFKYKPQLIQIAESNNDQLLPIDSSDFIILPKLNSIPSENKKKLLELLISIIEMNNSNLECNIMTLAEYMNISIYLVNKRLNYLQSKQIIQLKRSHNSIHIEFFEKKQDVDIKYKELRSAYVYYFREKFKNTPKLESSDFIVARNFCKKTEYEANQIRFLIKEYFQLQNYYLQSTGYKLKNFPDNINSILVKKPNILDTISDTSSIVIDSTSTSNLVKISQDQLDNYIKGKKEKKWIGTEDWAKDYEAILSSRSKTTEEELDI